MCVYDDDDYQNTHLPLFVCGASSASALVPGAEKEKAQQKKNDTLFNNLKNKKKIRIAAEPGGFVFRRLGGAKASGS